MMRCILLGWLMLATVCLGSPEKPNVLIVFAHQEPQSFVFALRNTLFQTLVMKGHQVKMSNLVQMKMIGALDTTDFTELNNKTYFHPQEEQLVANQKKRATFIPELRLEHDKVEWADYMLFVFPYYVMYMPGIMKSWMERVFSFGFAYGEHNLTGKKAMFLYATGADQAYLKDIEVHFWDSLNGVMEFMGVKMLKPFCAYGVQHIREQDRKSYLTEAARIASEITKREPYKQS